MIWESEKVLTFPYGEGGPPQRWKRDLTSESGTYFLLFPPVKPLLSLAYASQLPRRGSS